MALTVGIAGITGKFARRVVSHLLQHSDVTIRGYCRDPSKVPEPISSSEQVTLFKGDAFDKEAIRTFAQGCDVLICCYLGENQLMIDGQKILIDACEELGVPRYIASDWALDYTKLKLGELFPKDPMIHVHAYLATKQKVTGVHILIGGFMEPVLSPFFNILDPKTNAFRFWGGGDEIMEGTTYDNAAEFTTAVARDPKATGVIRFLGGRATIREIAQSYEMVYGVKANLERLGSLDDLYKFMHEKQAQNPADIYGYMSLFFYYYWINGQTFVGPELDNDRYPQVKPVSWEDYMKQWPLEQLSSSYFALNA
ncbi:NmrA-like family protein [Aspergillus nomiae NRRL 13137]|uniref:NmrA-like family protein n=1 Tax=Aspergillus nomiae NRRL (strain ATCC 15546 / NRRL 13137 / CBS 260.88 / M93) TaxID=1509407 RepID=A0A0L1JFF2_ASPN3|nr:NmrA-like family protein [Aspergillus nomiae NRRL 13137]KNG90451.1 NmrA-like family protein [Aspergillus nomiae NRRL 13137]